MVDIIRTYRLLWINPLSPSFGLYTSDNFPPGTNVYASTALAHVLQDDNAVRNGFGVVSSAFIYQWSVYGADGQIHPVDPPADPFLNAIFVDNCANITFAAFAGSGRAGTLATVFSR